ncbi:MAG TPA: hypothetical protein VGS17_02570 [Candidatus Limnocylindria bacterium]|nr:hypothetical protein [Candidatus Limnocylindria bacterium]
MKRSRRSARSGRRSRGWSARSPLRTGSQICPGAGWPVRLVAFHIARGFERQAEFVEEAQAGPGPHRFDWGDAHALNASVAAADPSPTRAEVMALGPRSVRRIAAAIGATADADLERIAFVDEGRERSSRWVVGSLAVDQARGHRERIAAAISS